MARRTRSVVRDARTALAKIDAGQSTTLTQAERHALDQVQREAQLRRPLASYAPRTRRRYLAAADASRSARSANASEYRERKQRAAGRKQRIEALRQELVTLGISDGMNEITDIEEAIEVYGEAAIENRLRHQIFATRSYGHGNPRPGNFDWHNRELQPLRGMDGIGDYADPLYYYHGRKD